MTGRQIAAGLTLLAALLPHPASAQAEPITVEATAEYRYGSHLSFSATVTASAPVTGASVFYRQLGSEEPMTIEAALTPGSPTVATALHNLSAVPLTPFATLEYWWQIELGDGTTAATIPATIVYEDNRFDWRTIGTFPITLNWVGGEPALAEQVLDQAVQAVSRIQRELAAPASSDLRIYLYPDPGDLDSALRLGGLTESGGHPDPALGIVLAAFDPGQDSLLELERTLAGELAQVFLARRLGESYRTLPAWLHEGLLALVEATPAADSPSLIEQAVGSGASLTADGLCGEFPASGDLAQLARAQSASWLRFLSERYGAGSVAALLDAHAAGDPCLAAIERVYGLSADQLIADWELSILGRVPDQSPGVGAQAGVVLLLPVAVLLAAGYLVRSRAAIPPGSRGRT